MKKTLLVINLFILCLLAYQVKGHCAVDLTGITFEMTSLEALAALIIAALAVIWVIKKMFDLVGGPSGGYSDRGGHYDQYMYNGIYGSSRDSRGGVRF